MSQINLSEVDVDGAVSRSRRSSRQAIHAWGSCARPAWPAARSLGGGASSAHWRPAAFASPITAARPASFGQG